MGEWPFPHGMPGRFVVGDPTGERFVARYYRDAADPERLHGKIWFGPGCEGPPLHAHGGSMAAVLDEVLGTLCWLTERPVLAAQLDTTFRAMLPLGTIARAEAWFEGEGTRSVTVVGRLFVGEVEYARARGVFVQLTEAGVRAAREAAARRGSSQQAQSRARPVVRRKPGTT